MVEEGWYSCKLSIILAKNNYGCYFHSLLLLWFQVFADVTSTYAKLDSMSKVKQLPNKIREESLGLEPLYNEVIVLNGNTGLVYLRGYLLWTWFSLWTLENFGIFMLFPFFNTSVRLLYLIFNLFPSYLYILLSARY